MEQIPSLRLRLLLLAYFFKLTGEILPLIPRKLEEAKKGAGVEQLVPRFPEDERQLLIVVGHQLGLRRLLRQRHHPVNVLDSLNEFINSIYSFS